MRKRFRGVRWLALAALVVGVVAVPSALADDAQGQAESLGSSLWFVELNGKPAADGGNVNANRAEKAAFREEAKKAGSRSRSASRSTGSGTGFPSGPPLTARASRTLRGSRLSIRCLPWRSRRQRRPIPISTTALSMTGADIAQSELGFDGSGVRVAVMDTGIDLDHSDLGGDGTAGEPFTNSRVVAQHDFVGDTYNANPADPSYQPVPNPDAFADDCNGHGTHVSGIVGADGDPGAAAYTVSPRAWSWCVPRLRLCRLH